MDRMGNNRAATDQPSSPSERGGGALSFLRDAWRGIQIGRALRAAPEQRSSLVNPEPWLMQALLGGPTRSGATVNEHTAFNVATVRACIDLRASLLASLPLKLYRRTATGPEELPQHPLARLLRGRVSPAQTRYKWIHASQVCHDLGGNAYSRIHRDPYAEPERIEWLLPANVTVLEHKPTGAIGYRLAGAERDLLGYEMLHVANLSTNGRTGRSPLADLREVVGLSLTAEEAHARSFANGNRKPGIIVGNETMTEAKAKGFLAFWTQHYAGAQNAGKMPLIWGSDWKDMGMNNADAELLMTRKFEKEEIATVFRIPLHLVNSTEKSVSGYGANIEQLNQGLVDHVLYPLCVNWELEMNTTLLTEREQDEGHYLKFNLDALLRGSATTRALIWEKLRGLRAITVNEIRRALELPEAPDAGANNLDWPLNNQGGGNTATTNQPAPAGEPGE
jgi:HK97 family phage portal protein